VSVDLCKKVFSVTENLFFCLISRLFPPPHGRDRAARVDRRLHPLREGDRPAEALPLQPGHGRLRKPRIQVGQVKPVTTKDRVLQCNA